MNQKVGIFILQNKNQISVKITNYGARIISIFMPDKQGKIEDICLGFETLEEYFEDKSYFGAICGRYANRIAGGQCYIEGKLYRFSQNEGVNTLHGGNYGLHCKIWEVISSTSNELCLNCLSEDGEEGFPGNLKITVKYTLTENNELIIQLEAQTDKTTIINLTSHPYFNLTGNHNNSILNHELKIYSEKYTPIDENLIPTGEIASVKNTPFDFSDFKKIGENIFDKHLQLVYARGYDHNFVLKQHHSNEIKLAAEVFEPSSGRKIEVLTTQPGLQFYTGNHFNGSIVGKNFKIPQYGGFCLEAQNFPDAPNHKNFPSALLKENETYTQVIIYKFVVV